MWKQIALGFAIPCRLFPMLDAVDFGWFGVGEEEGFCGAVQGTGVSQPWQPAVPFVACTTCIEGRQWNGTPSSAPDSSA